MVRRLSTIVISSIFLSLSFISIASAQQTPERALSVSPIRTEIILDKGASRPGTLTFYNSGKQPLSVQMNTQLFTVSDKDYNYTFDPDSPINQWVRYSPANFELAAGQSKLIEYSLNVPINAEVGDKYFSMFAATTPSKNEGMISSTERVGSLIYLTVPGEITRSGKLLDVRSPLIATDDSTWGATIQNGGSALFRSTYTATIKTLWGQALTQSKNDSLILANSVRLVTDTLKAPSWLGIYNVNYTVSLGDSETAVITRPYIYAPLPQLFLLLALILVVFTPVIAKLRKRSHTKKPSSSEE